MCKMSKCSDSRQPHALDGVGHDGDGDEVEYNDEDCERQQIPTIMCCSN